MADLLDINDTLTTYLRPQTYPVAIRMYEPGEAIPEKTTGLNSDLGLDAPLCNAISMARRYGQTMVVDKEQSCWVASISMGFLPLKPDVADGTIQEKYGIWGHTKEEAVKFINSTSKLPYGKYDRMVIAPLHQAGFEPHVVLVYGSPAQIWLAMTAYLFPRGEVAMDATLSIGAGCTTYIAKTMTTDLPQFGMVGVGERFNNAQDYECALAIPASKIEKVAAGLAHTHHIGPFRYPIPAWLRYNAKHPPGYDKMLEHLNS